MWSRNIILFEQGFESPTPGLTDQNANRYTIAQKKANKCKIKPEQLRQYKNESLNDD